MFKVCVKNFYYNVKQFRHSFYQYSNRGAPFQKDNNQIIKEPLGFAINEALDSHSNPDVIISASKWVAYNKNNKLKKRKEVGMTDGYW